MPKGTKTLGYRSQHAACAALARQGFGDATIARRTGLPLREVARNLTREALRPARTCDRLAGGPMVQFPRALMQRLHPAAEVRGLTVNQLVRRLVAVIETDGLIDSILDDGVAVGAQQTSED